MPLAVNQPRSFQPATTTRAGQQEASETKSLSPMKPGVANLKHRHEVLGAQMEGSWLVLEFFCDTPDRPKEEIPKIPDGLEFGGFVRFRGDIQAR